MPSQVHGYQREFFRQVRIKMQNVRSSYKASEHSLQNTSKCLAVFGLRFVYLKTRQLGKHGTSLRVACSVALCSHLPMLAFFPELSTQSADIERAKNYWGSYDEKKQNHTVRQWLSKCVTLSLLGNWSSLAWSCGETLLMFCVLLSSQKHGHQRVFQQIWNSNGKRILNLSVATSHGDTGDWRKASLFLVWSSPLKPEKQLKEPRKKNF